MGGNEAVFGHAEARAGFCFAWRPKNIIGRFFLVFFVFLISDLFGLAAAALFVETHPQAQNPFLQAKAKCAVEIRKVQFTSEPTQPHP